MSDFDVEDSLTTLNTQLNKSMVLMDTTENEIYQPKSNKSIKINTKIQPSSSNSSPASRKSILKKVERKNNTETKQYIENNKDALNNTSHNKTSTNTSITSRPHNITELVQREDLIVESTDSTLTLDNVSDSEEIWIMDIPRTIDPNELKGQTLMIGDKSKFKIKEERYCAVSHDVKCNVTCVFNTGKVKSSYKTANIKPAGTITVRRKLLGTSKSKPIQIENCSVPFPKNLKTRHPLFGVSYEGKVKKGAIK